MHPRRLARLNELILQTVSKLALELKDPGIGFITITAAELTSDLSLARIYYSVFGGQAEKDATAEALARATSHFRREIGHLENLRKVPQLAFLYDHSVERADRVARLLYTIQQENDANQSEK